MSNQTSTNRRNFRSPALRELADIQKMTNKHAQPNYPKFSVVKRNDDGSVIVQLRNDGDVPRVGDTFFRFVNANGQVIWQQQIHTGEYHLFHEIDKIAHLEASYQAATEAKFAEVVSRVTGLPVGAEKPGKHIWSPDALAFPIDLCKVGSTLTVIYGAQVDKDLNYSEACAKLGESILHALCCQGKLNADQIRTRPRNIGC